MAPIKNIIIYGAGGDNIGKYIVQALVEDGKYNVSVLSRSSSTSTYPTQVHNIRVDDNLSHDQLVQALKDQDAVIAAVGFSGGALESQFKVIDAAIEAGVQRFIPSEYGFDNADPKVAWLSPIFEPKNRVETYLRHKVEEHPNFSWTAVATSIWLEWALDVKFLGIDPVAHTVSYWDNGTHRFSNTTLPYAAQGVLKCLEHLEESKNKRIFMEALAASQTEIVAELEKQQGVKYQTLEPVDGAAAVADIHSRWERSGHTDVGAAFETVTASILMEEYHADFRGAGKTPILEDFAQMPKISLEDVVKMVVERQK